MVPSKLTTPQPNPKLVSKGKRKTLICVLIAFIFSISYGYFYYYNNIANTRGQARELRLPGLRELVCEGRERNPSGSVDQCGNRSIYADSDWGVTRYFTIYGVSTETSALEIAEFMRQARSKNQQDHIPVDVKIYSHARSEINGFIRPKPIHSSSF
jgi:hypothetical protein